MRATPCTAGNLIGRGVLICDPVHEPLSVMPDEDADSASRASDEATAGPTRKRKVSKRK